MLVINNRIRIAKDGENLLLQIKKYQRIKKMETRKGIGKHTDIMGN